MSGMKLPDRPLESVPSSVGARWFVVAGVPWWGLAFTIRPDASLPMWGVAFLGIVAGAIVLDEGYRRLPDAPRARLSLGTAGIGLSIILIGRGAAEAATILPQLLLGTGYALAAFSAITLASGVYREVLSNGGTGVSA